MAQGQKSCGLNGDKSRLATWITLLVLILVAFSLRAWHLDVQSLWRDEMDVIRFSRWSISDILGLVIQPEHNGPLYYLLMRLWLALVGFKEFGLRFLSLCFSVLAVPLAWRLARGFFDSGVALAAALLFTISPYMVWYAQDAKMYALVFALTLLSMNFFWQALRTGKPGWWAAFVVSASLSLYIHMLSALMIPVYVAAFFVCWPRYRTRWRAWLASLALLTLPYLPLMLWQLPMVLQKHETGHPFYPFFEMLGLLFNLYARGVAAVGGWFVLAAFVFSIFLGIFGRSVSSNRAEIDNRAFLAAWLLLPIGLIYLVSLRVAVFEPRYLAFAAPAFFLLSARGVVVLSRLSRPVGLATLAVLMSFSLLGLAVQGTTSIKSDFRSAGEYVTSFRKSDEPVMFQMPYIHYTFAYYAGNDYESLEGPWTNDGKSEQQVDVQMSSKLMGCSHVWLVASESHLWDERNLTRAWLDAHGKLLDKASFTLVDVYHYQLEN